MKFLFTIDKFLFYKFLKFGVVGISGMVIDFVLTYLCKEKFKINKYISNGIGFVCAATFNYILNRIWTFQSHNEQVAIQYTQFMIVSVIGLAINSLVLFVLNDKLKWNFYISKLFAIGVATLWNFFANLLFTFAE